MLRALAVVALLAAGCATVRPKPAEPELELDQVVDQGDAELPAGSPVLASAGGYFPPLQLEAFGQTAGQGRARACTGGPCRVSELRASSARLTGDASSRNLYLLNSSYTCFDGTTAAPTTCTKFMRFAGGGTVQLGDSGLTLSFMTASGSNAISFTNAGARLDLGPGAADHIYSSGGSVNIPDLVVGSQVYSAKFSVGANGIIGNGANFLFINPGSTGGSGANVCIGNGTSTECDGEVAQGSVRLTPGAAQPTCDASQRGKLWFTANGAAKDALEICRRDAAFAYAWESVGTM